MIRRGLPLASAVALAVLAPLGCEKAEEPRPVAVEWLAAIDRLAASAEAPGAPHAEPREKSAPRGDAPATFAVPESAFDCEVDGVLGTCMPAQDCRAHRGSAATRGHCPGRPELQCCTHYGQTLCNPTEVRQPNEGNTFEAPGERGCPRGMVGVDAFCIGRYEASLVQLDGRPWSPYKHPGRTPVRAVSVQWAVPQGYISGKQAAAACRNAGKRLCRDEEWLRACQGPDGTTFPYGDTRLPGVCNDHRGTHPAVAYFKDSGGDVFSHIGNACLNQLPVTLEPTGARAECVTAEGVFDMMGNLHEWTADPAGTFRGGYYMDTEKNGPGCRYATTAHGVRHWDYSTGFRCCADR